MTGGLGNEGLYEVVLTACNLVSTNLANPIAWEMDVSCKIAN